MGVHFDENNLYTLDTTGALVLTILATVAEEESRSKSFIMNWSIERRFSKGIFLTPKLLGYDLDEDGDLVVNPDEAETVKVGKKMQLSASVTLKGTEIANQDVTWTVSGNKSTSTTIDTNGLLTVGADEPFETILTIYAESQEMAGLRTYKTITVKPLDFEDIPSVTAGSTTTVTIDGVEWYVLVKDNGKALLWAKDPVEQREFNNSTSNAWQNSALRTYLNGTWLNKTTVLKGKAVQTDITTRSQYNATTWITTQDKVFLLSEADLFGTVNETVTANAQDYTYGNSILFRM